MDAALFTQSLHISGSISKSKWRFSSNEVSNVSEYTTQAELLFSIELVSVLLVSSNYEMLKEGCIAASSELEPCERAFWIEKRKLCRQSRVLDLSPTNFPQRLKINRSANTWVLLVRYMFEPSELNGRNVRGVSNKKPLDPEQIYKIRELVHQYFQTHLVWTWANSAWLSKGHRYLSAFAWAEDTQTWNEL